MMRSFFRNLEREGVEFLLISGQAAVLYGAATFSEDFDLWVRPTAANLAALKAALGLTGARVYKLTPALSLAHVRKGHGFHFTLPDDEGGTAFLDVMGRPPRVGSFARSRARCELLSTDWGTLPVVAIPELVQLKLTRRLADYDVISNLVKLRLQREASPGPRVLSWALESTFRLEDLASWLAGYPGVAALVRASERPVLATLAAGLDAAGSVTEETLDEAALALAREIVERQRADVSYWRPIIDELRQLRSRGALLEVGGPVR